MDYIVDNEIDLVMVTETWLSDSDNIWMEVSDLNKYGYAAKVKNRQNRRGGGVMIIHRDIYQVKFARHCVFRTFELGEFRIAVKNTRVCVICVYRPPYSSQTKIPVP